MCVWRIWGELSAYTDSTVQTNIGREEAMSVIRSSALSEMHITSPERLFSSCSLSISGFQANRRTYVGRVETSRRVGKPLGIISHPITRRLRMGLILASSWHACRARAGRYRVSPIPKIHIPHGGVRRCACVRFSENSPPDLDESKNR